MTKMMTKMIMMTMIRMQRKTMGGLDSPPHYKCHITHLCIGQSKEGEENMIIMKIMIVVVMIETKKTMKTILTTKISWALCHYKRSLGETAHGWVSVNHGSPPSIRWLQATGMLCALCTLLWLISTCCILWHLEPGGFYLTNWLPIFNNETWPKQLQQAIYKLTPRCDQTIPIWR